jgi:hypothetical protein
MPRCVEGDMASIYPRVVLKDRQGEQNPEILVAFSTDAASFLEPYPPYCPPPPEQRYSDCNKRMDVCLHSRPRNW